VDSSATRGTAVHTILENYITGQGYLDLTDIGRNAHTMAQTIIDKGLANKISEYYGIEATMYYPELYAGATDLVAVHDGKDSIIDFKQSNKPKKREWIHDYCLQLAAYAMAHNVVHGTEIQKGVIMIFTDMSSIMEPHEAKAWEEQTNKRMAEIEKEYPDFFKSKIDSVFPLLIFGLFDNFISIQTAISFPFAIHKSTSAPLCVL
jgi:genome maintenance exonuclease 1